MTAAIRAAAAAWGVVGFQRAGRNPRPPLLERWDRRGPGG